jgi:hypothetical protein
MSEARALTDKLRQVQEELRQTREQLDRQRTQHAREQEALNHSLDETRREAARLRERIAKAEARQAHRPALTLPTAEGRRESPPGAQDVLVALARPPASMEEALPRLAKLLGLSAADLRLRLNMSQPSLLARLPASEAERLRDTLTTEGFSILLGDVSQLIHLVRIRRFTLDEHVLHLESMKGEKLEVPYSELRLLARGRHKSVTVEQSVERVYDNIREQYVKETSRIEHERFENFLWIYGGDVRAALTEQTSPEGLGGMRVISKFAMLQAVIDELRKRAPQVVVDDRLVRMPRLSLAMVGPERSPEVLAGLTDLAIQAGLWP